VRADAVLAGQVKTLEAPEHGAADPSFAVRHWLLDAQRDQDCIK
jgi:hypothetical protein